MRRGIQMICSGALRFKAGKSVLLANWVTPDEMLMLLQHCLGHSGRCSLGDESNSIVWAYSKPFIT